MKIAITFNNEALPDFKAGWGFSCLITGTEKNILFDTGCEGPSLIHNIEKLGYSVEDIDVIVLSHHHWDHTGGLFDILNLNSNIEVYLHSTFSRNFANEIKKKAVLKVSDEQEMILDNVFTTGLLKAEPDEQSLLLTTASGVTVLSGCSHPGVDRILDVGKKYGSLYAVIGGFHGFADHEVLKDIPVVGPCHCSQYIDDIKKLYPDNYREIRAGDVLEID